MTDRSASVELYFDFCCPWSYLALVRLQDVCERNRAELILKPVSIARILETENPQKLDRLFAENPAKAAWQRKDLVDWAAMWGLTIDLQDDWPQDSDAAGAVALAAIKAGKGIEFCLGVFRAKFGASEALDDELVMGRIARECGLDARVAIDAMTSADYRAQVQRNSRELIERGGFGTPSMIINDSLFYGNDRVSLVEWTLGPMADDDFVMPGQHSQWK